MRVLVVARDRLVASSLRDELESMGHVVVGPVLSSGEALLLCNVTYAHCAIVDSRLEGERVSADLAHRLREKHGLHVLLTDERCTDQGCLETQLPGQFQDARSLVRMLSTLSDARDSN